MSSSPAYNVGHVVGTIAIYAAIIAIGVYFGNRLGKMRSDGTFVRWPVGVAIAVVLLALIGQCSSPAGATAFENNTKTVDVQQQTIGPASKLPQGIAGLNLEQFNTGQRDGVIDTLKQHGVAISPNELTVSSKLMSVGNVKAIEVRTAIPSRMFQVSFFGISGGDIVAVVCTSIKAQPFEPVGTECLNRAEQVFGGKVH